MKITLAAKDLACALKSAALLVKTRTTIPILAHVVIDADESGVQLRTTDMDRWFVGNLTGGDLTVHETGVATAPVKALLTVVSDADGLVEIESETANDKLPSVAVRFGRSSIKLSGLPPEDFPKPIEKARPCLFHLPAHGLRSLIDMTRRCISTEETRHYLNGLYLCSVGTELRMVATDGHRLAKAVMSLPNIEGFGEIPSIIIPRDTVGVLRRMIDKTKEDVGIEIGDCVIRFVVDGGRAVLLSKGIDGTFPDYGRVTPTQNDKHVEIAKADLLRTIKQVGKIVGKTPALRFDINQNSIEVIGRTEDHDTASSSLDCRSNVTMEIGLNWRYVADAIEVMDGDSVVLDIADNVGPIILRDTADADYLHVLMPMRM